MTGELMAKSMTPQTLPEGVNPEFVELVGSVYYDRCVDCRANTGIRTDCPVDQRNYYTEGSGQRCAGCYVILNIA